MCGVFGVYFPNDKQAFPHILNGLTVLQHRGQDSAGISTSDGVPKKGLGKVEKVFDGYPGIPGNFGIGHIRYCTAGKVDIESAQPLELGGISLVHNGNLTNVEELVYQLTNQIPTRPYSDSVILLRVFELAYNRTRDLPDSTDRICKAVQEVMMMCRGSFSVVMSIPEIGLVAFRDPRGIRPLCFGSIDQGGYAVSSESVAITDDCVEDIRAGECVIISESGVQRKQIIADAIQTPCLFEYIYFARPESTIDGILVYQARKNMGEALALRMLRDEPDLVDSIDVVMPVPDSGRISALRASYVLQKPYCEGLIRNNYVGRTFIMPSQTERKRSLKMKLNTIDQEFQDKTVLIIDDSIVRGNTSIQIVELIRKAGAKQIIFASIAPPVVKPNVYGIAIPSEDELIASHNKTHAEIGKNAVLEEGGVRRITGDCLQSKVIARLIGADKVVYNTLGDVVAACKKINPGIDGFETSCFCDE